MSRLMVAAGMLVLVTAQVSAQQVVVGVESIKKDETTESKPKGEAKPVVMGHNIGVQQVPVAVGHQIAVSIPQNAESEVVAATGVPRFDLGFPLNHAEAIRAMGAHGTNACTACHTSSQELEIHYGMYASNFAGVSFTGSLRLGAYVVSPLTSPLFRSHLPLKDEAAWLVVETTTDAESESGLTKGDVVVSINETSVADPAAVRKLVASERDNEVQVTLIRGGKKIVATIAGDTLAEPPEPYQIGVQVEPPGEALRSQLKLYENEGLLVVRVVDESPAEKAGVKPFDILLRANGERLQDSNGLKSVVNASAGKPLTLTLMRAGKETEVEVTPVQRPRVTAVATEYCPALQRTVVGVPYTPDAEKP